MYIFYQLFPVMEYNNDSDSDDEESKDNLKIIKQFKGIIDMSIKNKKNSDLLKKQTKIENAFKKKYKIQTNLEECLICYDKKTVFKYCENKLCNKKWCSMCNDKFTSKFICPFCREEQLDEFIIDMYLNN